MTCTQCLSYARWLWLTGKYDKLQQAADAGASKGRVDLLTVYNRVRQQEDMMMSEHTIAKHAAMSPARFYH
jgi:hypothetical protein